MFRRTIPASVIRSASVNDAPDICAIYNAYVKDTVITFEEQEVSAEEMQRRIAEVTQIFPWLVYEVDHRITGYAYASSWKTRSAYRYSVESTIYLDADFHRQGVGHVLYTELLTRLRSLGLHRVIGGIALPNAASVALHEKLGFRKVAHFGEVGFKFGRWIDVGYWQLDISPAQAR